MRSQSFLLLQLLLPLLLLPLLAVHAFLPPPALPSPASHSTIKALSPGKPNLGRWVVKEIANTLLPLPSLSVLIAGVLGGIKYDCFDQLHYSH